MEPVPVQLVPTCPTKWDYKAMFISRETFPRKLAYDISAFAHHQSEAYPGGLSSRGGRV